MSRLCDLPFEPSQALAARQAPSFAAYLPPVPRPPHDPFTLRLDARAGWRAHPADPALPPAAVAAALGADGAEDGLALVPLPGTGRTLCEPAGSFGGLTLPRHIARVPAGNGGSTLLLYDTRSRRLRRFDACACAFVDLACLATSDPRLPQTLPAPPAPVAVAASCGRLYLADRAARRVVVLNAATGAARAVWRAPLATPGGMLADWEPSAVATAASGADVWVADRISGALLRFMPEGKIRERHDGFGAVSALAADAAGHLLICTEGGATAIVYDPTARTRLATASRPGEVAACFAPLPAIVHADGSIDLSALCEPPCPGPCVFDTSGEPLAAPPEDPPLRFPASGQWFSQALDSGIADCVWDRITVDGALAPHTSLTIDALSAETELAAEDLAASSEWQTAATLFGEPPGDDDAVRSIDGLDFMLRTPPGRYLWLRVTMTSPGQASPLLTRLSIEFPRITWRRYLPAIFGSDPVSAEFTDRWLAVFDRAFRGVEGEIDRQARWFDPMSAPAGAPHDFLGWLASWVGVSANASWPLARRREFLKHAPRAYAWRGTPRGLIYTLYLFFGLRRWCAYEPGASRCVPCATHIAPRYAWRPPRLLLEHYVLRRWLWLGHARLSDNARLWGERIVNRSQLGPGTQRESAVRAVCPPVSSGITTLGDAHSGSTGDARLGVSQLKTSQDPERDPFHIYAHKLSIFVPAACVRQSQQARALLQLLKADVPAHVEFHLVPTEARFRVGVQAMLGLDAVIGYRTARPALGSMQLGRGTVLDEANDDAGKDSLRVGARRIGMNTTVR